MLTYIVCIYELVTIMTLEYYDKTVFEDEILNGFVFYICYDIVYNITLDISVFCL